MRTSIRVPPTAAACAVMLCTMTGTALAGGWASTTLDPLTAAPVAGTPTPVSFTVLQHGVTPIRLDGVAIEISREGASDPQVFPAAPDATVGRYTARVTFPDGGTWRWRVMQGDFPPHELGTVRVAAAPTVPAPRADGWGGGWAWALAGAVLAVGAGLAGHAASRRRTPENATAMG